MRFFRYLFAFWAAFAVYSLVTFAFGPGSRQVQKHLESEITRLSGNLNELKTINESLLNTAAALGVDGETRSVYMRQLGYGRPNEIFFRIVGLENALNPEMSPGRVLRAAVPYFITDTKIKITAMIFGLVIIAFYIIVDFLSLGILRRD